MNKLYILAIILLSSFQLASAAITSFEFSDGNTLTLGGRKLCSWCEGQGLKSTIDIEGTTSTSAFCGYGYYNEEGYYVAPSNCNTNRTSYRCSQGHSWTE